MFQEAASTGGSTTNYITGMMNIGLVKKTDRKRVGGAVIYQINDPKVGGDGGDRTHDLLNAIQALSRCKR